MASTSRESALLGRFPSLRRNAEELLRESRAPPVAHRTSASSAAERAQGSRSSSSDQCADSDESTSLASGIGFGL